MKLVIDRSLCFKSGQCQYLHPAVFDADDEGYPVVKVERPEGELLDEAKDAIEVCPSGAISLVNDDE
ncbi:MAG: hypothetical protein Kow0010_15710 [Dehalococcoidia bacterium]